MSHSKSCSEDGTLDYFPTILVTLHLFCSVEPLNSDNVVYGVVRDVHSHYHCYLRQIVHAGWIDIGYAYLSYELPYLTLND